MGVIENHSRKRIDVNIDNEIRRGTKVYNLNCIPIVRLERLSIEDGKKEIEIAQR